MLNVRELLNGTYKAFTIPTINQLYQNRLLMNILCEQLNCSSVLFTYVVNEESALPNDVGSPLVASDHVPTFTMPLTIFTNVLRNISLFAGLEQASDLLVGFELSKQFLVDCSKIPLESCNVGITPLKS